MSGTKEIRSKISSVEKTQKITSAMEMVATSKMRQSQERMNAAKPYSHALRRVISHIAKNKPNHNNRYIKQNEVKKACFIIVSTDRGLCGGLNTNLFKKALQTYSDFSEKGIEVEFAVIGNKAQAFFERLNCKIVYSEGNLGDRPSSEVILGMTQGIVSDFLDNKYQLVEVFANKFINTMSQEPTRSQFLPLPKLPQEKDSLEDHNWDYIYEGNSEALLDDLVNRYVTSVLYSQLLESLACEQAARMIAMKAATDNASQLIDDLTLIYNKARQTSITNELNEIVAGAAAV